MSFYVISCSPNLRAYYFWHNQFQWIINRFLSRKIVFNLSARRLLVLPQKSSANLYGALVFSKFYGRIEADSRAKFNSTTSFQCIRWAPVTFNSSVRVGSILTSRFCDFAKFRALKIKIQSFNFRHSKLFHF